jgi:hypothetical protein
VACNNSLYHGECSNPSNNHIVFHLNSVFRRL